MHCKLIALAAAATALTALPASAQELRGPFDGPYISVALGFDVQPNDPGETIEFDRNLDGIFTDTVVTAGGDNAFAPGFCNGYARAATPDTGCNNDRNDVAYYGRVGFDKQMNDLVFGVVAEFGKSEISDSVSAFSTTPASYTMLRELNWEATLRARAGFAVDTTLFYGTAGVGLASIDNTFVTTNTANAFGIRGDNHRFGVVAGGGIEQRVGNNFSLGLEYMFHRYQDNEIRVRATQGTAPPTNPFVLPPNTAGTDLRRNFDYFRWHSIRATAGYRF